MAISILYSGIIDSNTKPWALIDQGETYNSEAMAIQALSAYFEGDALSVSAESYSADTTTYYDVPNPWADTGFSATSKLGFVSDSGIVFNVGGVTGSLSPPIPNGNFTNNNYAKMQRPVDGALFIHLNGSNWDIENYITIKKYANGTYYVNKNLSNINPPPYAAIMQHVFISNNGACVFFYTHPTNYNGQFGTMGSGSLSFNKVGTIQPLRIYMLRAVASVAMGKVYDLGGNPASRAIVALNRKTKKVVGDCVSSGNGEYSMPLLAIKGDLLTLICFDDDAPPDVQAEIIDRVVVT